MTANLAGKVALITGGAQGLGRAFAECLLARGARVSLVDINQRVGEQTENELRQIHGSQSALFVPCDVTNKSELEGAFKTTQKTLGGLDIVVNNAGIGDEFQWEKMIAINLNAVIYGTMLGMQAMRTDKGGNGGIIVNVASLAGVTVPPMAMVYAGTKFGVVGYTRSVALTYPVAQVGVRVASLCPSFAKTEIMDLIRKSYKHPIIKKDQSLLEAAQKMEEIVKMTGEMETSDVGAAFMRLIDDERADGAVLVVTPHGQNYQHPKHLKGQL